MARAGVVEAQYKNLWTALFHAGIGNPFTGDMHEQNNKEYFSGGRDNVNNAFWAAAILVEQKAFNPFYHLVLRLVVNESLLNLVEMVKLQLDELKQHMVQSPGAC